MSEQLELSTFTGAHPTNAQFVRQLDAWGFTRRRSDGVHLVFRGPHGGTVRVLRSLLGRPDADLVAKAARLAAVTVARFWSGPDHPAADAGDEPRTAPPAAATTPDEAGKRAVGERAPRRRGAAPRDQVIAMVLTAHTRADRPLSFEEVVTLCRERITREQAAAASAALCRDGQLDRIRQGVYQSGEGRTLPRRRARLLPGRYRRRSCRRSARVRPPPRPHRRSRSRRCSSRSSPTGYG
jgi:predicted RNA binding protein YcfA (HicA-like mRNA interferase family)